MATYEISAMRVKLSTEVIRGQVDLGLVNESNNLEVRLGLDELETSDGTSRNETGTTSRLGAPCNLLVLGITNR